MRPWTCSCSSLVLLCIIHVLSGVPVSTTPTHTHTRTPTAPAVVPDTYNIVVKNSIIFSDHISSVALNFPSVTITQIHNNLGKLSFLGYSALIPVTSDVVLFKEIYKNELKVFEPVGMVYSSSGSVEKLPYTPTFSRLDESSNNLIRHGFCVISYDTYYDQLRSQREEEILSNHGSDETSTEDFVTVYVFDSGIQADLATFSGRVTTSSFCSQSSNCAETGLEVVDEVPMGAGHGTQVASIIGGVGFGINSNVRIVDVRVLDKLGVGRVDDIIAALDYVVGKVLNESPSHSDRVQQRIRSIINMSFSGASSLALKHALYAVSKVLLTVAAAGDDETYSCQVTPAESPHIIVASATSQSNMPLSGSNYGDCIDILAPGLDIAAASVVQSNESDVELVSGSSTSAAIVSGFASVLFSALLEDGYTRKLLIDTLNEDDLSTFLRVAVLHNERVISMVAHMETWAECSVGTKENVLTALVTSLKRLQDNLVADDPSRPKAFNNLKRNFASFTKLKNAKKYEE